MSSNSVSSHYAQVAARAGATCDATLGEALNLYSADVLAGIPAEALAASRGCGDPVAKACLRTGERVLDLGSGGGIDAIIASRLVGAEGFVYGLDMTPEMIRLARANAQAAGVENIEFLEGRIEDIPLPDASLDVVVSNCVINFSSDKPRVMAEALRVLKLGGRFVVSDIVAFEPVPGAAQAPLGVITGCTNGITLQAEYGRFMRELGFTRVAIEPKTIYTEEKLREKAVRKGHEAALAQLESAGLLQQVAGKTGSAIISAWK